MGGGTGAESNLQESAAAALFQLVGRGESTRPSFAFDFGLQLARIVLRKPIDAEGDIRAAIDGAVAASAPFIEERSEAAA